MAKQLTKAERDELTKNLAVLQAAVTACQQALAEDNAAEKSAQIEGDRDAIKAFADRGQGREAIRLGILASREMPRAGGPSRD